MSPLRTLLLVCSLLATEAGAQAPTQSAPVPSPGWGESVALARMEVAGAGERTLLFLADTVAGLRIYDATTPGEEMLLGSLLPGSATCPTGFFPDGLRVLGARVYLAAGACGVLVIDASDPRTPGIAVRVGSPVWAKDVLPRSAEGGVELLVADYFAGLRVIELREAQGSESFEEKRVIGPAQGIVGAALGVDADPVSGTAVVATTDGVFDVILGGTSPLVGAFLTTNGLPLEQRTAIPEDVAVRDDYAYVPLWKGGLAVIDLLNPSNPTPFGNPTVSTPHAFFQALLLPSGATLLASEGQCGLAVFDVTPAGLVEKPWSPLAVAGTDPQACGPNATDPQLPFAWSLAELDGVVAVGFGAMAGGGGFELVQGLEGLAPVAALAARTAPDADADGAADAADNCALLANPGQADADRDGFGDACDADLDGDGIVGGTDWIRLARAFDAGAGDARYDAPADLDADGIVAVSDWLQLYRAFGSPPGPSGLVCAGTAPCP